MHTLQSSGHIIGLLLILAASSHASEVSSGGICFVPNAPTPQDDNIWLNGSSKHPAWYYNYQASPSTVFSKYSSSEFEFVSMLWVDTALGDDASFLTSVINLVNEGIENRYVLAFDEPDFWNKWGVSELTPEKAARTWLKNIIPLR